ncbi:hypothetical protein H4R35_002166 [Dimargaris xerosporica]|nr:hypothetical protein H4R35_002166 [Dimargaris xerosporica]
MAGNADAELLAKVMQLVEMGIDNTIAHAALAQCNYDVAKAADFIFSGGQVDQPLSTSVPGPATPTGLTASNDPVLPAGAEKVWSLTPTPPNNEPFGQMLPQSHQPVAIPIYDVQGPLTQYGERPVLPSQTTGSGHCEALGGDSIVGQTSTATPAKTSQEAYEDDLRLAIQASLETHQQPTPFDPQRHHDQLHSQLEKYTTAPPPPLPSRGTGTAVTPDRHLLPVSSHEDSDLAKAIEASMASQVVTRDSKPTAPGLTAPWSDPLNPLDRRRSSSETPVALRPDPAQVWAHPLLLAYAHIPGLKEWLWEQIDPAFEWPSPLGCWSQTGRGCSDMALDNNTQSDMHTDEPTTMGATTQQHPLSYCFLYEFARLLALFTHSKRAYIDGSLVTRAIPAPFAQSFQSEPELLDACLGRIHTIASRGTSAKSSDPARSPLAAQSAFVNRFSLGPPPTRSPAVNGFDQDQAFVTEQPWVNVTIDALLAATPDMDVHTLIQSALDASASPITLHSIADVLYLRLAYAPELRTDTNWHSQLTLNPTLYLDQYLPANRALIDQCQANLERWETELEHLGRQRHTLFRTLGNRVVEQMLTATSQFLAQQRQPSSALQQTMAELRSRADASSSCNLDTTLNEATMAHTQHLLTGLAQKYQSAMDRVNQSIADLRRRIETVYDDPQLTQHLYRLHAILFNNTEDGVTRTWIYVRRYGEAVAVSDMVDCAPSDEQVWWRIAGTDVEQASASEDDLLRENTMDIHGLVYVSDRLITAPVPNNALPDNLAQHVAKDNAAFAAELRNWVRHGSTLARSSVPTTNPAGHSQPTYHLVKSTVQPMDNSRAPLPSDLPSAAASPFTAALTAEAQTLTVISPLLVERPDFFLYSMGLRDLVIQHWTQLDSQASADETAMVHEGGNGSIVWMVCPNARYQSCFNEYLCIVRLVVSGLHQIANQHLPLALETLTNALHLNTQWETKYAHLYASHGSESGPRMARVSKQSEIQQYLAQGLKILNQRAVDKAAYPFQRDQGLVDGLTTAKLAALVPTDPRDSWRSELFGQLQQQWLTLQDAHQQSEWSLSQTHMLNDIVAAYLSDTPSVQLANSDPTLPEAFAKDQPDAGVGLLDPSSVAEPSTALPPPYCEAMNGLVHSFPGLAESPLATLYRDTRSEAIKFLFGDDGQSSLT